MSNSKKEGMFAKLVQLQPNAQPAAELVTPEASPPSPAPAETSPPKSSAAKKKPEPAKGKRDNPDYCQANAYVPKSLRRAVDRALLDIDGLDYSTLVTDLLRKWVKSRGVSE
jgi:hypothetical protein